MNSFLSVIVSNTAIASALALIAFGVQRIGRSPALAHALWLLVLIKLVTPTVFHVALPNCFGSSIGQAVSSGGNEDRLRVSVVVERMRPLITHSPKQVIADRQPIPAAAESAVGSVETTVGTAFPAPAGVSAASSLATLLASRWQVLFCAVWAAGVIVAAVNLCRRLVQFRTLLLETVDGDAKLVDDARTFVTRLGMRNCPSIRVLDAHVPPLVFAGWRDLMILIPAQLLSGLDREQLHAVLIHELAHIRRRDHLTRWFELFVRGIFWWHPLVWLASRQLRQVEEECCDAWVVWALPDGRRSYGKALLWTIEFLGEHRPASVVAGTALGGSHVKRRIEMIMGQQRNRRLTWGAILTLIVLSASVLPVTAQLGDNEAPPEASKSVNDSVPSPTRELTAERQQVVPEKRDLEARIEQLERLVQEFSQSAKPRAVNTSKDSRLYRYSITDSPNAHVPLANFDPRLNVTSHWAWTLPFPAPETEEDLKLKETLVALNKRFWDAVGKGDQTVSEQLLDDHYFGFYVNAWGFARSDKATEIAAVKRRRYFDLKRRDEVVKRTSKDTAILTYIYSCKVEESGQLQTYRDHQATQVWTQKDNSWVLSFSQDFILPGGE